ncbi:hypothetical protein BYT27DRAFT_6860483 [Phlegmacium glaucopus]|nr:hypothetical protein BYT27DRAFT_6860483 [Phlegmacium glaucopus]
MKKRRSFCVDRYLKNRKLSKSLLTLTPINPVSPPYRNVIPFHTYRGVGACISPFYLCRPMLAWILLQFVMVTILPIPTMRRFPLARSRNQAKKKAAASAAGSDTDEADRKGRPKLTPEAQA